MFNRKIQVDLVKNQKPNNETVKNETFSEKMAVVSRHLDKMARSAVIGVAAFVILDTFRQVMIEKSKTSQV